MNKLIDLEGYPVKHVLNRLLQDKTTGQNILFATNTYAEHGPDFQETSQLTAELLLSSKIKLQPRVEKAAEERLDRTRRKAEVFTPSWIVNKMNNHCDEKWFGRSDVFNRENGTSWITNGKPILFDGTKTWRNYVDSRRIEITCGEAPYIVSRYDASTGEPIPVKNRIGILDRKLRVVNENAAADEEWLKWTERAFQSSYGYEFQGDNLLIARINLLVTFVEHYAMRFGVQADIKLLRKYTNIICWNFWQMDGITGTIPFGISHGKAYGQQVSFTGFFDQVIEPDVQELMPVCKIRDWRAEKTISYDVVRGCVKR